MDCNRCGKRIGCEYHLVEDFAVCKNCYPKAKYELGHTKILKIGGQQ